MDDLRRLLTLPRRPQDLRYDVTMPSQVLGSLGRRGVGVDFVQYSISTVLRAATIESRHYTVASISMKISFRARCVRATGQQCLSISGASSLPRG